MAHPSAEFRDPHGANVADARSRDAQDRFFLKDQHAPIARVAHCAALASLRRVALNCAGRPAQRPNAERPIKHRGHRHPS